jgi:hypothetical protein
MLKLRTLMWATWSIGCTITSAVGQAPAIDVKTGLWEVSSTRSSNGMPAMPQIPPEALARMPPEQRARVESAMKAAQAQAGGSQTHQFCLTREALRSGPSFGAETRPSCQQTTRTHSRTRWEMRLTCSERGGRQAIHVQYEAPKPDIMHGTVEIVMSNGDRQMTMKQVMRGRWLGSGCGEVKPK